MEHPKLINNISERVVDDIKGRLSKGTFVSIAAASFSIYAYEALKEELEGQSIFSGENSFQVRKLSRTLRYGK